MVEPVRRIARWFRHNAKLLVVIVLGLAAIVVAGLYSNSGVFASNAFPVVLGGLALCLSAWQYYRTDLRAADVRILLVNRPTTSSTEAEDQSLGSVSRVLLSHPIVVENIGARPCVVTDIVVTGQLPRENWYRIEANIDGPMQDQLAKSPVVLIPRDPQVLNLSYFLTAAQRQPNGWSNNLPKYLLPLAMTRPRVSVRIIYTAGSETRNPEMDFMLDADEWRAAVEDAAAKAPGTDGNPE